MSQLKDCLRASVSFARGKLGINHDNPERFPEEDAPEKTGQNL